MVVVYKYIFLNIYIFTIFIVQIDCLLFGHFDLMQQIQIKLRWALFVTYTIIQSIMRSEMCSLHLTHPSALGAVGSRLCGARGAVVDGAGIRTHNLGLPRVSSPTLYPLGHDCWIWINNVEENKAVLIPGLHVIIPQLYSEGLSLDLYWIIALMSLWFSDSPPRSPVLQEEAHAEPSVSRLNPPVLGLEWESCNQGERWLCAFKARLRVIH